MCIIFHNRSGTKRSPLKKKEARLRRPFPSCFSSLLFPSCATREYAHSGGIPSISCGGIVRGHDKGVDKFVLSPIFYAEGEKKKERDPLVAAADDSSGTAMAAAGGEKRAAAEAQTRHTKKLLCFTCFPSSQRLQQWMAMDEERKLAVDTLYLSVPFPCGSINTSHSSLGHLPSSEVPRTGSKEASDSP